jgi:hypothetical protein
VSTEPGLSFGVAAEAIPLGDASVDGVFVAEAFPRIGAPLDRPVYRRRWTATLYWTRLAA